MHFWNTSKILEWKDNQNSSYQFTIHPDTNTKKTQKKKVRGQYLIDEQRQTSLAKYEQKIPPIV